jgi:hypothetical protein
METDVFCRMCGTWIGKQHEGTWGPNGGDPPYFEGPGDEFVDDFGENFCSMECLEESEVSDRLDWEKEDYDMPVEEHDG